MAKVSTKSATFSKDVLPGESRVALEQAMPWFLFQRRLAPLEVIFVTCTASSLLYLFVALFAGSLPNGAATPPLFVSSMLLLAMLKALFELIRERRWVAISLSLLLTTASVVAVGMVQVQTCPHATYVQLFGASYAIRGQACGNWRNVEPWWYRD